MKKLLLIPLTFLLASCASPYYASLDASENSSGSLEIEFVSPGQATLTINDIKIDTPSKWVSSVIVSDISPGTHRVNVHVVRRGSESMFAVEDSIQVFPNQKSTMIVSNPKKNGGHFATMAIIAVGTVGVLAVTGFYNNPNE